MIMIMIMRIDSGLDEEVTSEDNEALKGAMGHIRDVRKSTDETSEMFALRWKTVKLLKSHSLSTSDVQIDDMDSNAYLKEIPLKRNVLVSKNFQKMEETVPLQNAKVDQIKAQLDKFFLVMGQFRGEFRANAPFEPVDMAPLEVYKALGEYDEKDRWVKFQQAEAFNKLERCQPRRTPSWGQCWRMRCS